MRLISAAPRGVTANSRSSATTLGLRFVIASSARSASASENASTSPLDVPARSLSPGRRSIAAMSTTQESVTADQYTVRWQAGRIRRFCNRATPRSRNRTVAQSAAMAGAHPSFRDIAIGDLLTRLARALPDREALVYAGGPRYTFETLEREARTIARGLMALGVAPGERVVLWATNVPEWVVLQFALAKIGAVLVTANTSLRARDIDYLLRQSEAATLITIRGFRQVDYLNELRSASELPGLHRRIFIGDPVPDGFTPYASLRDAATRVSDEALDARGRSIGITDVINMQYTSGTTGFPKGVMLTSRNIVNNGHA